jgi:hypothetical protein
LNIIQDVVLTTINANLEGFVLNIKVGDNQKVNEFEHQDALVSIYLQQMNLGRT